MMGMPGALEILICSGGCLLVTAVLVGVVVIAVSMSRKR